MKFKAKYMLNRNHFRFQCNILHAWVTIFTGHLVFCDYLQIREFVEGISVVMGLICVLSSSGLSNVKLLDIFSVINEPNV